MYKDALTVFSGMFAKMIISALTSIKREVSKVHKLNRAVAPRK